MDIEILLATVPHPHATSYNKVAPPILDSLEEQGEPFALIMTISILLNNATKRRISSIPYVRLIFEVMPKYGRLSNQHLLMLILYSFILLLGNLISERNSRASASQKFLGILVNANSLLLPLLTPCRTRLGWYISPLRTLILRVLNKDDFSTFLYALGIWCFWLPWLVPR